MSTLSDATAHTRFWSKVDTTSDECWLWTGAKTKNGKYGVFRASMRSRGGIWRAHRWSWAEQHGPIPEGIEIDHECRNGLCVRPAHLRPATTVQNMQNRRPYGKSGVSGVYWSKGRWEAAFTTNGERHYLGRFHTQDAAEQAIIARRREVCTHFTSTR